MPTIISDSPSTVVPATFKVFVGSCHAVVLSHRGGDSGSDRHVCVTILTEDDGNWFVAEGVGFSSYWFMPLLGLLNEAQLWLVENCTREPGLYAGWTHDV